MGKCVCLEDPTHPDGAVVVVVLTSLAEKIFQVLPTNVEGKLSCNVNIL